MDSFLLFLLCGCGTGMFYVKPGTHMLVCKPNARMCGWDCKHALGCLRTVNIPFIANQNLPVFGANTKEIWCIVRPMFASGLQKINLPYA